MRRGVQGVAALFGAVFALLATPAAAQSWPSLRSLPETRPGGGEKDAALVIAVEEYASVEPVPGARANAEAWVRFLRKGLALDTTRIRTLYDDDARDYAILEQAGEVGELVQPGGRAWLIFIGHGAPGSDGEHSVLVGYDAEQSAAGIYRRSVKLDDVLKKLRGGRAERVVAVVDACFSGKSPGGDAIADGLQPLVTARTETAGATLLTAGRSDEFAGPLPGADRPAFSYLLLGALRGWGDEDDDGEVTPEEAAAWVERTLGAALSGRRSQHPQATGPAVDRPLVASAHEPPPEQLPCLLHGDCDDAIDADGEEGARVGQEPEEPGPTRHRVQLATTPEGATVAVDGEVVCDATPCSKKLQAGRHAIRFSRDGHADVQREVDVSEDRRVTAELASAFGRLSVKTPSSDDASVVIDGEEVAEPPIRDRRLPADGPVTVRATGPCHEPVERSIELERGGSKELTLEPEPRTARLDVSAVDGEGEALTADVRVDGAHAGETPGVFEVSACAEALTVRHGELGERTRELSLTEGRTEHVRVELERRAPPTGAGIEWVRIPGGRFEMGSRSEQAADDERPRHEVELSLFRIAKSEVTHAQYAAFLSDRGTGCGRRACLDRSDEDLRLQRRDGSWQADEGWADHPVTGVTWDGARAFCEWAGGRLPTEAEWEYAARSAGAEQRYPWGDAEMSCDRAVAKGASGTGCGRNETWPVCSKNGGHTEQGVCDMAGNVWEWVHDWYGSDYYARSARRDPEGPARGSIRVVRGGSFVAGRSELRTTYRGAFSPRVTRGDVGFRCVRSDD